jgi:hypothetical protein
MKHFSDYINESKILEDQIKNKVDYYYLNDDISLPILSELEELFETGIYRALVTFDYNIVHFENFPFKKIALINYPPERYTKHNLKSSIKKLIGKVDEIEFPWNNKYNNWKKESWDEIILLSSENGIILRPMLEMGLQDENSLIDTINILKKIGIYTIMTSTGLVPEITTIEKWNEIKTKIPRIFEVKVGGILTLQDINNFLNSDVDLAATSLELKFNKNEN